ncbi:hypothetical protein [[Phormidium] sp. LEGE 05292]|nr:hypothetical protein [Phormidium sp. LEGE 05292]
MLTVLSFMKTIDRRAVKNSKTFTKVHTVSFTFVRLFIMSD